MKPLMKCGHAANAVDKNGNPCCYLLPIADETCRLLYYDKHGVVGCYVQKWLIEKIAKEKGLIK